MPVVLGEIMPDAGTKVRQSAKAMEFAVEVLEYNIFFKKKQKQEMMYGCYTHFQSQHVHKGRTWFSGKCAALVIQ